MALQALGKQLLLKVLVHELGRQVFFVVSRSHQVINHVFPPLALGSYARLLIEMFRFAVWVANEEAGKVNQGDI